MDDLLLWMQANWEGIVAAVVALYTLASAIVALTPTKEDDAALRRFVQRIAFLKPKNVPGLLSPPGKREEPPPPDVDDPPRPADPRG